MVDIIYKQGDLLKASEPFILHGCNAQGVMGSGVAKLLRDADEGIFAGYRSTYEHQGNWLEVGSVVEVVSAPLGKTVLNGITQKFYGRDPDVVYADYDGIRGVMILANQIAEGSSVAMPLVGAGLANGKWSIISKIIEEEFTGATPVVYLIDGVIPDGVTPTNDVIKV